MKSRAAAIPADVLDEPSTSLLLVVPGLTERGRRFAEAYFLASLELGDSGATLLAAYRRAFPLAQNVDGAAYRAASHLIREPAVIDLIGALRAELSSRALVPAERVAMEIERIAFQNPLDFGYVDETTGQFRIDLRRMPPEAAACISEVETKVSVTPSGTEITTTKLKFYSKLTALDQLNRVHGRYQDKLQVEFTLDDVDRAIIQLEAELTRRGLSPPTIDNEPTEE